MRNLVLQSLPPGGKMTLEINPPIGADERHYLLSPPGTVVVRVVDDAHIAVINPHDKITFFVLAIGPVMHLPTGVYEAISAFLTARKSS
jgi:hypothetical protein